MENPTTSEASAHNKRERAMSKLMTQTIQSNGMNETKYLKTKVRMTMNGHNYLAGDIGTLTRNKSHKYVYNFRINGKTIYTNDLILNQCEVIA